MAPSAPRALLACLACTVLALRPVGPVEAALDLVLAPLRLLAEMASPVGLLQARAREEAGRRVAAAWPEERARHDLLEDVVLASALPTHALEGAERGLHPVHGEVVGRERGASDRLRVRVQEPGRLRAGQPVVHGDSYVGKVVGVPGASGSDGLARDEVVVELVTAADSRVCARLRPGTTVGGEPCRLVVGGLATRRDEDWLAVHNPSRRDARSGVVEVYEPPDLVGGPSVLANGFLLGDLVPLDEEGGRGTAVRPWLDFESGLYQVLVLTPAGRGASAGLPPSEPVLDDGSWLVARLPLRGSPSPWREGTTLALGRSAGVRAGAALAVGARLWGRVEHAGLFRSSIRTLGDPGLSVAALALVEGEHGPEPHVLGRVVSLGRDGTGHVLLRWSATVPYEGPGPVEAELWTGSGEPGIPRGLLLGTTLLPSGEGPHLLRLAQPAGTREPWQVRVRLPDHALLEGLEGGGS